VPRTCRQDAKAVALPKEPKITEIHNPHTQVPEITDECPQKSGVSVLESKRSITSSHSKVLLFQ
jgi:hypothetical protein